MDNNFENRLQAIEYELSQVAESEYLDELRKKFTADEDIGVVVNIITPKNIVFKTRSLLSQILNRLELTHQDRLDLEKYIVYGGGDNIEYIKQTLAIWLEWKDKIFNIIKDAPEEFDSLIEIFNYINKHIEESTIELQNIPFEKSEGNNSAILKRENNKAISEAGIALGKDNFVGLKGWYYKALNINTSTKTIDVYLSKNQTIPIKGIPSSIENDIVCDLKVGDSISLVNDNKWDNKFKVVKEFSSSGFLRIIAIDILPFTDIKTELVLDIEDYSIYCLDKPDIGVVDLGIASIAAGRYNKATNNNATAFGFNNHAYGKFSFVEGRDNQAGYAAHAEGRGNVASGEQSHAEGKNNIASGNYAHVEGGAVDTANIASGIGSHAEGQYTRAIGQGSHSEGLGVSDNPNVAQGQGSHVEGRRCRALQNGSHAEGTNNETNSADSHVEGANNIIYSASSCAHAEGASNNVNSGAPFSHIEGVYNVVNNEAEHAQGIYNKSNADTIHSVGVGTSDTNRKNAHEIMKDGKHYIIGIGGYDGTNAIIANSQGIIAKDVATVINELINKLNEITTND